MAKTLKRNGSGTARKKREGFATALPALKRAAKRARQMARMHQTKIHFIRDEKIVSEKP